VSTPERALLLENIHSDAAWNLKDAGWDVERLDRALGEDELADRLQGVALLGVRSNTTVPARVLERAPGLLAIGAFCIGTNQIDLTTAAERGVAVFNAPFSNTRSVVELALSEIIALTRRLTVKDRDMHAGRWDKSAVGSHEVRGRRSASSATATSAASCRCWPRRWACRCCSTTRPTSSRSGTPAGAARSTSCSPSPTS
jgi:D-3-phosphoglycerate dehydrogenase